MHAGVVAVTTASPPTPEVILEWLLKEMGYPYTPPSVEQLRKICRGNMVPVWSFLLRRVRSERTVSTVRRNILVHGAATSSYSSAAGWRMGAGSVGMAGMEDEKAKEAEARERDLAEEEAERLRGVVRRQRKELRARIVEVAREESQRKCVLEERSNSRHKEVMLEAYNQQCDEASKIFAEYERRLHQFVTQARDVRRTSTKRGDGSEEPQLLAERKTEVYPTAIGKRSPSELVIVETSSERSVRNACEMLSSHVIERIRSLFPAYDGAGTNMNSQADASKLGLNLEGEVPECIKEIAKDVLENPSMLLQSVIMCTSRFKTSIQKETEQIDIRADSELLRYKYENDRVMDSSTTDPGSPFPYQVYGNGKTRSDVSIRGTYDQLLERQKAHVEQFLATEDAQNKAAEAKALCDKLLKRLHGGSDLVASQIAPAGNSMQNASSGRQLELDVWAKEREVAGLRASLSTLTSEVQRLNKLCTEWKEAEDSLKKKWKKIEEFDARRSELECVYRSLNQAIMDASAFWEQQPLAVREHASRTIIPACNAVVDMSTGAKDLIERELSAFSQSFDNSLYMLPATPQALLEAIGSNGATGAEALAAAERNASIFTARAGARDPSAIPSICRIATALRSNSGVEGSESALTLVLDSLEFCLRPCGSEANILDDLSKTIGLIHTRKNLASNDRVLLNHAHRMQQEYERMANFCLKLAAEQEKLVLQSWLPELREAVLNAQRCLEDCKRVNGLVEEWWGQPASTVVDWVTVDGQTVGAWLTLVKQLQLALYNLNLS